MAERPQGPDPARMTAGEAYMDGNADAFSESAAYLYGAASVSDGTARVALWRAAEVMQQRERDCRTAMRSRAEETFTHVPMRPYTEAEEAAENWPPDDDGVSGQDRKSYTDDQDRESYVVDGSPEGPDERLREAAIRAARKAVVDHAFARGSALLDIADGGDVDAAVDAVLRLPLLTAELERADAATALAAEFLEAWRCMAAMPAPEWEADAAARLAALSHTAKEDDRD